MTPSDLVRFQQKYMVDQDTGCWIWIGSRGRGEYGQFSLNGRTEWAHRAIFEHHHGPIPNGLFVCHNCPSGDNPSCVNPDHLYLGTAQDNMDDKVAKGRQSHFGGSNPGESNPSSILKEEDVIMIRELYKTRQFSQTEIACYYGISQSQVSSIVTGRNWSHV